MPNWVYNTLIFDGDKKDIRAVFDAIKNENPANGVCCVGTFDFNKIIPTPEELNIPDGYTTDKMCKAYAEYIENGDGISEDRWILSHGYGGEWYLGKQAYENIQKYGVPTCFDWHIAHWGTKWNADQCRQIGGNAIEFNTAWSAPHPVIEKLSRRFPRLTIEHEWADEDLGTNCGRYIYSDGEITEEYLPGGGEAIGFAANKWEYDAYELADCLDCDLGTAREYISLADGNGEFKGGYRYTYALLSRLQTDCEYFLGNNGRSRAEKHLWAGNVKDQIAKMRELYASLPETAKPEWISERDIDRYERLMTGGAKTRSGDDMER